MSKLFFILLCAAATSSTARQLPIYPVPQLAPNNSTAAVVAVQGAPTDESWVPDNVGVGYALAILTMVCWGSWGNSTKPTKNVPFGFFYFDYSVGLWVCAIVFFVSLGKAQVFVLEQDQAAHALAACAAGVVFNIANVLLVIAIKRAGLALAFPVGIGSALVFGAILTYIVDPTGKPSHIFGGVAVAFLAVLAAAASENAKSGPVGVSSDQNQSQKNHPEKDARRSSLSKLRISVPSRTSASASTKKAVNVNMNAKGDNFHMQFVTTPKTPLTEAPSDVEAGYINPMMMKQQAQAHSSSSGSSSSSSSSRSKDGRSVDRNDNDDQDKEYRNNIILCIVCGLLMSAWSPINAWAIGTGDVKYLTSFAAFLFFTTAVMVTSVPICLLLLKCPPDSNVVKADGEGDDHVAYDIEAAAAVSAAESKSASVPPSGYFLLQISDHFYALLGGFVWAIGTLSNSVSGGVIGYASSYAIGQCAMLVATLWGILYFGEYKGAPWKAFYWAGLMVVLFLIAIVLIALARS